jgi:dolichol-phosphate mannosyltransferase
MPEKAEPDSPAAAVPLRPQPSLVSIVVPVFNEEGNVRPLADAVAEAMGQAGYELIFVDDGSTDGTLGQIEAAVSADGRVAGVSFSRNFGHQAALAAGLRHAAGQVVVTMDGDLQHPPALIPQLVRKWRQGWNVVQTRRRDEAAAPWLKRATSRAFYRVFSRLCGVHIDPGMSDYRLLDRSIVDELNRMNEGQLFLRGLVAWMGYRQAVVPFQAGGRLSGRPKYTLARMLRFAKAGVFSFSAVPLRLGVLLGALAAILAFGELVYVLIAYFTTNTVPGWASSTALISLLFGILFLLIGVQGEYVLRIYERVQSRPPFLVERVIRRSEGGAEPEGTGPSSDPA